MLRSSEASRSSDGSGMLRSEDFAQHDNSAPICKDDFSLDEPCRCFLAIRGGSGAAQRKWQIAAQLTAHDALSASARKEILVEARASLYPRRRRIGVDRVHTVHAIQADVTSVVTFAVGAALPLIMGLLSSYGRWGEKWMNGER